LAVAQDDLITLADLPVVLRRNFEEQAVSAPTHSSAMSRADALGNAEKNYLTTLLHQNDGNITLAARQADISRQALHKLLKKYGLDPSEHRR
jgi:transcriptional regulator of acetoin/glycerol metabolism